MSVLFKILDDPFCFTPDVTVSADSENPNFPASNLKNPFRSAVWRSSGNFVIDSSNNRLDFDEGSGNILATLTSASYSPDGLAAEIKTQMEASGSETYTVSYSPTTLNFTITSDTGGTLDLPFATGPNAGSSVGDTIGFTADLSSALTYSSVLRIHTEEGVVFDLQTAEQVDSIVLLFPKSDGIRLTTSAVVTLQASATNVWTSPGFETTLTIDEDYEKAVKVLAAAEEYRYWRLKIVDPLNSLGFVEIGQLVFQKGVDLGRAPEIGFSRNFADTSQSTFAASGHKHTDIYPTRETLNFSFNILKYLEVQTLHKIFRRVGTHQRICVILDSEEDLFQIEDMTLYGTFAESFDTAHVFQNRFNVPLQVIEEF